MKKRLLSVVLAISMLLSFMPTQVLADENTEDGNNHTFTDIRETDWFYDAVIFAFQNGIFTGTSAQTFDPNGSMTRAMFVTTLGRFAGVDITDYSGTGGFTDVNANEYYAPYVVWAVDKGITAGVGDSLFSPHTFINREQMAVFAYRLFNTYHVSYTNEAGREDNPHDLAQASSWAAEAIAALWRTGIFSGDTTGNFNPQNTATRAQVAQLFQNVTNRTDAESIFKLEVTDAPLDKPDTRRTSSDSPGSPNPPGGGGVTPSAGSFAITNLDAVPGATTLRLNVSASIDATLDVRILRDVTGISTDWSSGERIAFGQTVVSANTTSEIVEVVLSAALPEHFVVEAVIVDDTDKHLIEPVIFIERTLAFKDFENKAEQDFPSERVISLDNSVDTNFMVAAQGVNIVDASMLGMSVTNGVFTFNTPTSEILALSVGDRIIVQDQSDMHTIEVATISHNGGVTTITARESDDITDFFDFMKVDLVEVVDHIDNDVITTGPGVVFSGSHDVTPAVQPFSAASDMALDSTVGIMATDAEVDIGFDIKRAHTFNINFNNEKLTLNGSITAGFEVSAKLIYDVVLFGKDYFYIEAIVGINGTVDIAEFELNVSNEHEIDIAKIPFPIANTGIVFTLDFKIAADWEASISASLITGFKAKAGFIASKNNGVTFIRETDSFFTARELSGDFKLDVGLAMTAEINFWGGVVEASVTATPGVYINGTMHTDLANDPSTAVELHKCHFCIEGPIGVFIKFSAKASGLYGLVKVESPKAEFRSNPLFYYFLSINSPDDGVFNGKTTFRFGLYRNLKRCENYAFKTVILPLNPHGNRIDTGTVTITGGSSHAIQLDSTNSFTAFLYPNSYMASAQADGYRFADNIFYAAAPQTINMNAEQLKNQQPLNITNPSPVTFGEESFTLSTTGGSGSGAISYHILSGADAVTYANNGMFLVRSHGRVEIEAEKGGDAEYNPIKSPPIFIDIQKRDISNAGFTLSSSSFNYNSYEQKPNVILPNADVFKLLNRQDLSIVYEDNINAGTASVILTALENSNFTGSTTLNFSIAKAPLTIWVENETITAGDPVPDFTVRMDGFKRTEEAYKQSAVQGDAETSTDYTPGSPSGSYDIDLGKGTLESKNYEFILSETQAKISVGLSSQSPLSINTNADGAINILFGDSRVLTTAGGDESSGDLIFRTTGDSQGGIISIDNASSNIEGLHVGEVRVYAERSGDDTYSSVQSEPIVVKVLPRDITDVTIGTIAAQTFASSEIKPEPTVSFNHVPLQEGTDFTFEYSNNLNAGTATITIRSVDNGNFHGMVTTTFAINPRAINSPGITVGSISPIPYNNGQPICPPVAVTDGNTVLVQDRDYTLEYSNNVNIGNATVTIRGKGNYSGTQTTPFYIHKLTGAMVTQPDLSYRGRFTDNYVFVATTSSLLTPTGQMVKYAVSTNPSQPPTVWLGGTTISNLTPGQEYYIWAVASESATHQQGPPQRSATSYVAARPIYNSTELRALEKAENRGGYFILANNLTLNDWQQIKEFHGTLDGGGFAITLNTSSGKAQRDAGLFSHLSGNTTIKNLTVTIGKDGLRAYNSDKTDPRTTAGALVVWVGGGVLQIDNVTVSGGTIESRVELGALGLGEIFHRDVRVGGMVGWVGSGATVRITNSTVNSNIKCQISNHMGKESHWISGMFVGDNEGTIEYKNLRIGTNNVTNVEGDKTKNTHTNFWDNTSRGVEGQVKQIP